MIKKDKKWTKLMCMSLMSMMILVSVGFIITGNNVDIVVAETSKSRGLITESEWYEGYSEIVLDVEGNAQRSAYDYVNDHFYLITMHEGEVLLYKIDNDLSTEHIYTFQERPYLHVTPTGTLIAVNTTGVYRSTDEGTTFTLIDDTVTGEHTNVYGMTIDTTRNIIYMGKYARWDVTMEHDEFLYKSDDDGLNWEPIFNISDFADRYDNFDRENFTHFHGIEYNNQLERLVITGGDGWMKNGTDPHQVRYRFGAVVSNVSVPNNQSDFNWLSRDVDVSLDVQWTDAISLGSDLYMVEDGGDQGVMHKLNLFDNTAEQVVFRPEWGNQYGLQGNSIYDVNGNNLIVFGTVKTVSYEQPSFGLVISDGVDYVSITERSINRISTGYLDGSFIASDTETGEAVFFKNIDFDILTSSIGIGSTEELINLTFNRMRRYYRLTDNISIGTINHLSYLDFEDNESFAFESYLNGGGHTITYSDNLFDKGIGRNGIITNTIFRTNGNINKNPFWMIGGSLYNCDFYGTHVFTDAIFNNAPEIEGVKPVGGISNLLVNGWTEIKDIYVDLDIRITLTNEQNVSTFGGMFGTVYRSSISNVHGNVDITVTHESVFKIGGLIGEMRIGASLEYASIEVDIDALNNELIGGVGGLVGNMHLGTFVSKSHTTGIIHVYQYGGGVVGRMATLYPAEISEVSSDVLIRSSQMYANLGGIIGHVGAEGHLVSDSYFVGELEGGGSLGGLAAGWSSNSTASNIYTAFDLISTGYPYAYAFTYNLLGEIEDSVWDLERTGLGSTHELEGNYTNINNVYNGTTDEMKSEDFYPNTWDFVNVWGISDDYNDGYPYHRWRERSMARTHRTYDVSDITATVNGNVIFDYINKTSVYFQYREVGETDWQTTDVVNVTGDSEFEASLSGLTPSTTYEFRAVSEWNPTSEGMVMTFTTDEAGMGYHMTQSIAIIVAIIPILVILAVVKMLMFTIGGLGDKL